MTQSQTSLSHTICFSRLAISASNACEICNASVFGRDGPICTRLDRVARTGDKLLSLDAKAPLFITNEVSLDVQLFSAWMVSSVGSSSNPRTVFTSARTELLLESCTQKKII